MSCCVGLWSVGMRPCACSGPLFVCVPRLRIMKGVFPPHIAGTRRPERAVVRRLGSVPLYLLLSQDVLSPSTPESMDSALLCTTEQAEVCVRDQRGEAGCRLPGRDTGSKQ